MKINLNKIIIGTWGLSGDLGKIEENPIEVFNKAIELGYNEFDTAPTYGNGKLYKIINRIPYSIKKNMRFNTKCGYNEKTQKKTFTIKDINRSVENSLDVLGKINVLFLHNPRNEIKDWKKIFTYISNLKKKKYIKYSGISLAKNFYLKEKIINNFDFVQDELNLLTANNYSNLKKYGTKIHIRSPFALGILTNKKKIEFKKNDYRIDIFSSKERKEIIISQIEKLKIIDKNLKRMSFEFLFSLKKINKIIFGVKTCNHLYNLKKELNNLNRINQLKKKKIFLLNKNFFNIQNKKFLLY